MAAPAYLARKGGGFPGGFGPGGGVLTSNYMTFVGMTPQPAAGDIVFVVATQYAVNNPDLAPSAGWTVDAQHNSADWSWIVFHRTLQAGDIGPTLSGIFSQSGADYWFILWVYRNFNGFDGTPVVTASNTPVLDLPSGTVDRTETDSLVVAEWAVPFGTSPYNNNERPRIVSGPNGATFWPMRFDDTFGTCFDSAPSHVSFAAGTFGPIVARRKNVSTGADVSTHYISVMYALRSVPVGGWGVGMVRMGSN